MSTVEKRRLVLTMAITAKGNTMVWF